MRRYGICEIEDSPLRGNRRKPSLAVLAVIAIAGILAAFMPAAAFAQPAGGTRAWSDGFSTGRRIAGTSGTKVSGGALKLSESAPTDLEEAVPGETGVYSLVTVGENVYSGTGEKGHLVEYDAGKPYQEGYLGPSHSGVSSSRGQVSAEATRVTALATDGSKVFGGTSAGRVFSFNPASEGSRPQDKGTCPGVTGGVLSATYYSSKVFYGTSDGYVFSYDDSGETFVSLGQVAGSSPVKAIAVVGGSLYAGLGNGNVYAYAGASFAPFGVPDGSAVNGLAASGTVLYAGLNDGKVYSYDTAGPGPFADRGTLGGASPVKALSVCAGVVFAGADDGHLYSGLDSWSDEGAPPNAGGAPVNALAVSSSSILYGGTGLAEGTTGRLFRRAVDVYEEHGRPSGSGDLTSIAVLYKTLYVSRGDHLYTFTSPGNYDDLGAPSPGNTIREIDTYSSVVYLGMDNGHLYSYNSPSYPEAFHDEGGPSVPSPVESVVARSSSTVYVGLSDGRLLSGSDMGGTPLATLAASIGDMSYKEGATGAAAGLYIAAGDGKLFRYTTGGLSDLGDGGDSTSANALAVYGDKVHVGHDSGNIYSFESALTLTGAAPSAITSMVPGSQGVACGSAGGRLYIQGDDGLLRDQGLVPPGGAPLALCHSGSSVWIGMPGGYLVSHDDANLGDLGQQVNKQIMIWCMTYDPGRHVFYAGTYTNAHFLVIDPATDEITDLGRPIPGERELEDIIVTREGTVVGSTYGGTDTSYNPDGGHLFTYEPSAGNPSRGEFTDRGRAPAPDNNWWISSLVEGPDTGNLIYAATSNSAADPPHQEGRFFSVDKTSWGKTDLGVPVSGEGTRALTRKDEVIFGATWQPVVNYQSSVYKYTAGGGFETLGEAPPVGEQSANKHVNRLMALGDKVYASQNNGNLFSFQAASTSWEPSLLGAPVEGAVAACPLAAGEDGTVLSGTIELVPQSPEPGHLVSWDDILGAFRDIDVSAVTSAFHQDSVVSIARGDAAVGAVTMCGTRGMGEAVNRYAARVFRVDPYRPNQQSTALSTVVDPSVEELAASFAGQEAIGAACPAPGEARQVYVGTANGAGGEARLYRYDTMTGTVAGPWAAGAENILSLCPGPDGNVYIGTGNSASDANLKRFDPTSGGISEVPDGGSLGGFKGIHALVTGPDSLVYIGAGDKAGEPGRLLSYDPATGSFADRGQCNPSPGSINGLVVSGSQVIGVTGSQPGFQGTARFFSYTPGDAALSSLGNLGMEYEANALVSGPGGTL
ncbi:MAG: hypothetical protein ACYC99_04045, partial [Candidatus Geothermincolia bacterium]